MTEKEKAITECVVCSKEITVLESFNGEMMCEECYKNPDNQVFTDDSDEVVNHG